MSIISLILLVMASSRLLASLRSLFKYNFTFNSNCPSYQPQRQGLPKVSSLASEKFTWQKERSGRAFNTLHKVVHTVFYDIQF